MKRYLLKFSIILPDATNKESLQIFESNDREFFINQYFRMIDRHWQYTNVEAYYVKLDHAKPSIIALDHVNMTELRDQP